tara:strand:+ start:215 stop:421 length:207 start_codon:yes stop_codon:yes gene_type:complete
VQDIKVTGSLNPFDQARFSVYNMMIGLAEASAVKRLFESEMEEDARIESLCSYLLSDPRFKNNTDLPN